MCIQSIPYIWHDASDLTSHHKQLLVGQCSSYFLLLLQVSKLFYQLLFCRILVVRTRQWYVNKVFLFWNYIFCTSTNLCKYFSVMIWSCSWMIRSFCQCCYTYIPRLLGSGWMAYKFLPVREAFFQILLCICLISFITDVKMFTI